MMRLYLLPFCLTIFLMGCNWMDSNYWEMEQRTERNKIVIEELNLDSSNLLPEIKKKYSGEKVFSAYMKTADSAAMQAPNSKEFADLLNSELKKQRLCLEGYMDLHTQYDRTFSRFWGLCK